MLVLLVGAIPLFTCAQTSSAKTHKDSVAYYQGELNKLRHKTTDSLMKTDEYKALADELKHQKQKSEGYSGMVVYGDIAHTDYANFNNSIVQNGFSAMQPMSFRFGFGVSAKTRRTMLDFYFATAGLNNKSTKGDENIKSSFSNLLQLDLGCDLLKSKTFSLYPYVGLSLRASDLSYSKPVQTNSSYTNITNIISNDQSTHSESFRVGYQFGIGFDAAIKKHGECGKTILFTKIGTNSAMGGDVYKINGIEYRPDIRHGDWLVSIGFKFATYN